MVRALANRRHRRSSRWTGRHGASPALPGERVRSPRHVAASVSPTAADHARGAADLRHRRVDGHAHRRRRRRGSGARGRKILAVVALHAAPPSRRSRSDRHHPGVVRLRSAAEALSMQTSSAGDECPNRAITPAGRAMRGGRTPAPRRGPLARCDPHARWNTGLGAQVLHLTTEIPSHASRRASWRTRRGASCRQSATRPCSAAIFAEHGRQSPGAPGSTARHRGPVSAQVVLGRA